MQSDTVQALRSILERTYATSEQIRHVAESVGVDVRSLDPGAAPSDLWASVMGEVCKNHLDGPCFELCRAAIRDDRTGEAKALLRRLWGFDERPHPAAADASRSPFRGLRPYEMRHADDFFGRDEQAMEVLLRLEEFGRVLISGEMGTGKSSLAMAGVMSRYVAGTIDGDPEHPFTPVVYKPGATPWQRLAAALKDAWMRHPALTTAVEAEAWASAVEDRLQSARDGSQGELWWLLTEFARSRGRVVLLVDQLEELLGAGVEESERRAFSHMLAHGFSQPLHAGVRLLATVRADALPRLLALSSWKELALGELPPVYTLGPMEPSSLATAIRGPARQRGVEVDDELVSTMTREAGQTVVALPLVSVVLDTLWQRRPPHGGALTTSGYRDIGGISHALDAMADQVWRGCSTDHQRLLERMLRLLVDVDPNGAATRRRVGLSELDDALGAGVEVKRLVDHLEAERLLVASVEGEAVHVELAHDALIHNWARLSAWIAGATEALVAHHHLRQALATWQESSRTLWIDGRDWKRATALQRFAREGVVDLTRAERAFLARGRRARVMRYAAAASLVAFVVVTDALFARAQSRAVDAESSLLRFVSAIVERANGKDGDRAPWPRTLRYEVAQEIVALTNRRGGARDDAMRAWHAGWLVDSSRAFLRVEDYRGALAAAQRARALYGQTPRRGTANSRCEWARRRSLASATVGFCQQVLRDWRGARASLDEAVRFADDVDATACGSDDQRRLASRQVDARRALGSFLAEVGDLPQALDAYAAARGMLTPDDALRSADLTLRMAALHLRLGHAQEAHQLAVEAQSLATMRGAATSDDVVGYARALAEESADDVAAMPHVFLHLRARPSPPRVGAPTSCEVELTGPLVDNVCFPACRVHTVCEGGVRPRAFSLDTSCVPCERIPRSDGVRGSDQTDQDRDGDGLVSFDTSTASLSLSPPGWTAPVTFALTP